DSAAAPIRSSQEVSISEPEVHANRRRKVRLCITNARASRRLAIMGQMACRDGQLIPYLIWESNPNADPCLILRNCWILRVWAVVLIFDCLGDPIMNKRTEFFEIVALPPQEDAVAENRHQQISPRVIPQRSAGEASVADRNFREMLPTTRIHLGGH